MKLDPFQMCYINHGVQFFELKEFPFFCVFFLFLRLSLLTIGKTFERMICIRTGHVVHV